MKFLRPLLVLFLLAGTASAEVERRVAITSQHHGAGVGRPAANRAVGQPYIGNGVGETTSLQLRRDFDPGFLTNAVFATGGEARRLFPGVNVSDNKNYAIFPYYGRTEVLELIPPVIGVTSSFTAKHFVQLFQVQGECSAIDVYNPQRTYTIRARNAGPIKNEWLDPAVRAR